MREPFLSHDAYLLLSLGIASALVIAAVILVSELQEPVREGSTPTSASRPEKPPQASLTDTLADPSRKRTGIRPADTPAVTPQPEPPSSPLRAASRDLRPPIRLSTGASPFGYNEHGGNSDVFVDNGKNADALVRLIRYEAKEVFVRDFIVRAGESYDAAEVRPGNYVVRIAYGTGWDDASRMFRENCSYSGSQVFHVDEYSRTNIVLRSSATGNFKTYDISERDFWR